MDFERITDDVIDSIINGVGEKPDKEFLRQRDIMWDENPTLRVTYRTLVTLAERTGDALTMDKLLEREAGECLYSPEKRENIKQALVEASLLVIRKMQENR